MVHCVIGCGEVDIAAPVITPSIVPIFNELREVYELTGA